MNKAVLISIRGKWCDPITSGRKTIEVRKTRPKLGTPFKCYIYETKAKCDVPQFVDEDGHVDYKGRGQVIGEFVCDRIDRYTDEVVNASSTEDYSGWNDFELEKACIHPDDLEKYADGNALYGWHISELKTYDKPKDISAFYRTCPGFNDAGMCWTCDKAVGEEHDCGVNGEVHLSRPPQSWCYVYENN